MTYRVEIAATAKADIRETTRWLGREASPEAAARWLAGLYKAMGTLAVRPLRCPVAAESERFPAEIRELLYGRARTGRHRTLFMVRGDGVNVLDVRHTARDELEP